MADFIIAYSRTSIHEGGWNNDPTDKGGETFKGISRKFWPAWNGWPIIDSMGTPNNFYEDIAKNMQLEQLVREFYIDNFWNKINGDRIVDQDIANEVYDTSVNMGYVVAVIFLQRSLNLLNNNGKLYKNITVDGVVGPETLAILNTHRAPKAVLKCLNGFQFERYKDIAENSQEQEKYFLGWLNRI